MVLGITLVAGLFVWLWYAIKRHVVSRGRREVGLPAQGAEATRAASKSRMPPTSLVLLSAAPHPLSRELVATAIRHAWGVEALSDDETAESHWVFGQTEQLCTVSFKGTLFTIVSLAEPYKQDRDWYVGDDTPPELLSAWQKHRAWISIDLAFPGPLMELTAALDLIGKLAAELAGEDVLAVVRPATRHVIVFDEEVRRLLRRRPAREVVTGPVHSLVILQNRREPVGDLGTRGLAARVQAAWGVALPLMPAGPGGDFCAVSSERGGAGFLQTQGIRFGVMTPEGAYLREPGDLAAAVEDADLRQRVAAHTAWTAIDLMAAPVGVTRQRVYQLLGHLAAEFADDTALALLAPALRRVLSSDAAAALRGPDPLAAILQSAPQTE